MSVVVVAAEVFASSDTERSVAQIVRVAGGVYVVAAPGHKTEHPTYDDAVDAGEAIAAAIDAGRVDVSRASGDVRAYVAKLEARVAELEKGAR